MLILIGTVPTAYALNHAVGSGQVQDFVAVSEQAANALDRSRGCERCHRRSAPGPDRLYPDQEQTPTTMLAAAADWFCEIEHEVHQYKTLKGVPANQQSNVRNDMYIASEALRLMAKSRSRRLPRPKRR